MTRVNSRAKGARIEREAADTLSCLTTLEWERTAQRWGNGTADIWAPKAPYMGVHVEVKGYGKGLARPTMWTRNNHLVLTRDDLYMCRLHVLQPTLGRMRPPEVVGYHNLVSDFMRQAERDSAGEAVPLVVMRQDRCEWIAVWRYCDDDKLAALLAPYLKIIDAE